LLSTQITSTRIYQVLVGGFASVIVLLLAAGFVGVKNAQLIEESSGVLVQNQLVTTRLIEELQREQETVNAVFYKLSRNPELADSERILAQLEDADHGIQRIVQQTAGTAEGPLWRTLSEAANAFSAEARRLLMLRNMPGYSSRDLFRRHEDVVAIMAKVINEGYQRAIDSQTRIGQRSKRLVHDSFFLLGGCLLLALICSIATVRITGGLFRKMAWQTGELGRVTWHMLENQETTARRFSHELHDELGQSLTALKANLTALSCETTGERARLEDCQQLADHCIQNVRELSQLLRPTILDDFGLDAGLRWLAERFSQRTGIVVDYTSDFNSRLPDETETHLFRIVQEALTNVARHSRATRVEISLKREARRICLTLKDNGCGLQPASGPGRNGMGLIGMRARARNVGGGLNIASGAGGVTIEMWVPLPKFQRSEIVAEIDNDGQKSSNGGRQGTNLDRRRQPR
jgi:signal transduction histidine kinase